MTKPFQWSPVIATHLPGRLRFEPCGEQGFGDRYNTWPWAMRWWKGHLYVGTNRAFLCAERASLAAALPLFSRFAFVRYPPEDRDAGCPEDPTDLPLQAEIWRWSPETDAWERVYQSPQDVPIPGKPGKFVARDIGFRDMAVFQEPDGTEAMYVSGVNSRFIYGPIGPPRLLRTVDGETFEPVPHDPGTFLGNLDRATLRTLAVYDGRLFIVAGRIHGDGVLLESARPYEGNDSFRQVSPEGMSVFEMVPFNGYLYLGLRDPQRGYSVVRTDAQGDPPYRFETIVPPGAFLPHPSLSVISMFVFRDHLYVGTDRPAELIRIDSDGHWDLIVGTPRETPDGPKVPLSGLDAGFYNWLNGHLWRMEEYEGRLYLGTMNMSTHLRLLPEAERVLSPHYGFDLFESRDGIHFAPVTFNGFGDPFAFGARTLEATPHGLFVGAANSWFGLQIWRGLPRADVPPEADEASTGSIDWLETCYLGDRAILGWPPVKGARRYRVYCALVSNERRAVEQNPFIRRLLRIARSVLPTMKNVYLPRLPDPLWIPGVFEPIAEVEETLFVASDLDPTARYLYFVVAEAPDGADLTCSTLAAVPSLAGEATVSRVEAALHAAARDANPRWAALRDAAARGDWDVALQEAVALAEAMSADSAGDELPLLLRRLAWRLELARDGLIPPERM
ncbi:MAG: hypothetical protein Kow0047_03320 [Anaerolineae bacterium]